ncbi:MAG: Enoyl-CoA hydratase/isomerase [Solirubrobacterales bacterium]|nr:Enoyl-CoA hydratase/isomerase [Solirubrobacterales bacterium]
MTTATLYESFTLDVDDGVGHVRFTQADRGNPFDVQFCAELSQVITDCDEHPGVRCVLVEGAGRFFSVGGDLACLGRDRDGLGRFIQSATIGLHAAISRMSRMDAPVVVAVHALAAGGAVSLAAAADFCLAGRSAKFLAAYQGIGLAIDGGGSHSVPRRVGSRRATEFYLRNQTWDAERACRYGLVNDVVEDGELAERARSLARELAAGPTRSFGEVKNLLASTYDQPLEAQLELEARAMRRSADTEDAWHGITAMAAKRAPVFKGA